jgi:hypothetical protein
MMFDLRLGLALGKSLEEVRRLPYKEILLWRMFYLVEPWGFVDQEFRDARLLAQLYNINAPRNKQKPVQRFMRNMVSMVMNAFHKEAPEAEVPDLDTKEGQAQATEIAVQKFKEMFGGNVIDARKR